MNVPSSPERITRLVWVRHGATASWAQGRCCGRLDPELAQAATRQMASAATWLLGMHVAAVYASPSRRAVDSARLIAPDFTVRTDPRLYEMHFGALEGLSLDDAARRFPEVYRAWMRKPHAVKFPGGESLADVRTRTVAVTNELQERHHGETIVIVSHAGVIRLALARVLGLRPARIFRLAQDYGAVNIVEYHKTNPLVRLINATARPHEGVC